jgi:hypothetical protein
MVLLLEDFGEGREKSRRSKQRNMARSTSKWQCLPVVRPETSDATTCISMVTVWPCRSGESKLGKTAMNGQANGRRWKSW